MRKLFSTDGIKVRDRFRLWREISRARLPPFEMRLLDDRPFEASWEAADIGGMRVSRTAFSPYTMENQPYGVRQSASQDKLVCVIRLSGDARISQHDRAIVQRPGDITVFDSAAPLSLAFDTPMTTLRLELPRDRLERMLGPTRLFAALPVGADLPGASLARTFFGELVRVHEGLGPETAERMASVGVDLLVASIAERMAQDTPRPIQGTVLVQRAKAYVETHIGDAALDPPQLAAAMGVSLRHLHQLFHERGRSIAAWIWQRRLETAAQRLADPAYLHLSVGTLAYGCGFTSQAHFSRRFKDRYDMSPSDYRRWALAQAGRV